MTLINFIKNNKALTIAIFIILIGSLYCLFLYKSLNTPSFDLQEISLNLAKQKDSGDCLEYTNFYKTEFDKLNINYTQIFLHVQTTLVNNTLVIEGHTFLIVYSSEGYCNLDKKNVVCYKYLTN